MQVKGEAEKKQREREGRMEKNIKSNKCVENLKTSFFFSLSLFFYIFRLGLDLRVSLHTLKDHENCCIFHSKKKKVVV
jgi:hypothetical protein